MSQVVALMPQRREEIRAIRRFGRELAGSLGVELAHRVLGEAIAAEAESEGHRVAPAEPEEAGLVHFARVLAARDSDGGAETGSVKIDGHRLTVERTRCDYPALYRASGFSEELAYALSCGREGAFARGYDRRLRLESCKPPKGGDCTCLMVFLWEPETPKPEGPRRTRLRLRSA
jgi:hypothetical protein